MTNRTSVELSKLLLVACDQSYFNASHPVSIGDALTPLDDKSSTDPAYDNLMVYNSYPSFDDWRTAGYTVYDTIERPDVGAKLVIFQNTATKEVIVAFGGTDGIDAQDWKANTQSVGWEQWAALNDQTKSKNLFGKLALLKSELGGEFSQLHFTGQSLGGVLAQYAAYEYVAGQKKQVSESGQPYDPSNISLTTFNGLGAVWGLQADIKDDAGNPAYNPNMLTGIGQSAHYVVANDIVSQLGGGHVGANNEIVYLDWKYQSGESSGKYMDIADAHRIETAFYTHLDSSAQALATAPVRIEGASFPLINAANAVKWAGALGNLLNNEDVGPMEAVFRFIMGAESGVLLAPPDEVDAVAQAFIKANHEAGKIGDTAYQFLSSLNLGYVGKAAVINQVGGALYLGSLLGSVLTDAASNVGMMLNKVGSWIGSLFEGNPTLPATNPQSQDEAILNLKESLQFEPDAFKNQDEKAKAQENKDRVSSTTDMTAKLAQAMVESGLRQAQVLVANAVSLDPANAGLSEAARAHMMVDALWAIQSTALTSSKNDPALFARVSGDIVAFVNSEFGQAITKINSDFLQAQDSPIQLAGLDSYVQKKTFTDSILEKLEPLAGLISGLLGIGSANAGEVDVSQLHSALKDTIQTIKVSAQTIILQPGRSDANPFDGDLSALDTNTVDVGQIGEGHYKAFTLYLPYAAGLDGLTIRLTLNGTAANKFVLLDAAAQTELGSDGVFEIYIAPGERQAGFGLWAKAQVGNAETLGLAAQLLGSDGTPSHLGHLEINLDLSTANGADGFDRIIAGDLTPIDTDPAQDGIQARHDDLENLIVDPSQEAAGREDILYDSTGHDKLQGLGGSDILHAKRGGDDRLEGGLDSDVLLGGAGNDELYANDYQDFETALAANDLQVDSTNKGDLLDGGEGDDIAVGFEGRDALVGGAGDDILMGGGGDDILSGDETVNTQYMSNIGHWKIDRQVGTEGDLTSYRRIYQNLITEQKSGDDILLGGSGDDWLLGGAGQDWLDGGAGNDVAFGEAGDDQITGGDGNDVLSGDTIDNLADPANSLPGILHGDDYLAGGAGDDTLAGNGGNDQLFGGTGNDDISGDDIRTPGQYHGADTLNGEEGNDNLWGNGGNDELYGGSGNDHLEGDYSTLAGQYHGNDYLDGGEGDDILIGEGKDDTLYGGEGADTFDIAANDNEWRNAA